MNQVPGHSARSLTYGSIMLRVHSGYRASETESDVTRDSKVSSPLDSFRCERLCSVLFVHTRDTAKR